MAEGKPTAVEKIKEDSIYLKGNLAETLADPNVTHLSEEGVQLIKHHGSYQQYDRDTATKRKKAGLEKEWQFMVRLKLPGGRLTAEQYFKMEELAKQYANGTLRITTRQTFQFHGTVKENLKKHIAGINHALLSTLAACGDVVRNVVCTPAPIKDEVHNKILEDTMLLAEHCAPKTSAYHEIWVDGENVARTADNENLEPLYGKWYLPRKFKIGIATPEDNSIDVLAQDLGLIHIYEGNKFIGYNLCLGGGLGMSHNKPSTYPRLATPIAFVGPDDLIPAVEAIIELQRDNGDRTNRKHARLKYVVEEKGIEWTRKTLESYFGRKMEDPKPMNDFKVPDHMGWHEQKDGKWFLGIPISSGRITDRGEEKILTGLHAVIEEYKMDVILTCDQNIILADIEENQKEAITSKLKSFGIKLREDVSNTYRNFMACVALPTCGLALAEAERVKLPLVAEIEALTEKHNIANENIAIRMTGCPNGCARPYIGDIGIVGRMPGHYALFIGGDFEGTRLNTKIFDRIPFDDLKIALDALFTEYTKGRQPNEGFGNFCHRSGVENVLKVIKSELAENYKWAA